MKCSVKRNVVGKIQSVTTQQGEPSLLYKELTKYYEGNKELALSIYAKAINISHPSGRLNTQGEPKLQYVLSTPVEAYNELFDQDFDIEDVPHGIARYMAFAQNEVRGLQIRLRDIASEKHNGVTSELLLEEQRIKNRLEGDKTIEGDVGLIDMIEGLKQEGELTGIRVMAQKDLVRLDHLAKSTNAADMQEAERLATFYIAVADFTDPNNHPLLQRHEIVDDQGNLIVDPEIIDAFDEYRGKAERAVRQLNHSQQKILMNMYHNSPLRSRMGELTYEELISKEGLKDATWTDAMIMDMSKGILSHNGYLPQIMHNRIQNTITTERGRGQFHNGMNLAEVSEVLNTVGKRVQNLDPTFNVLMDLDENGDKTGELIGRVLPKYRNKIKSIHKEFNNWLRNPDGRRESVRNNYYKARNNAIREQGQVMEITKIPELMTRFQTELAAFPELGFNFQPDEDYRDEIANEIGEDNLNAFIEEQTEKIENFVKEYTARREAALITANLAGSTTVLPDDQQALHVFIIERSPVFGLQTFNQDRALPVSLNGRRTLIDNHLSNNVIIPKAENLNTRFATVQNNSDLKQMYDVMSSIMDVMYRSVPERIRDQITPDSLLTSSMVKKAGKNFNELTSRAGIYDAFAQGISVREDPTERGGIINLITGDFSPEVAFQLQANETEINRRFNQVAEMLNASAAEDTMFNVLSDKDSVITVNALSDDQIQMIADMYEVAPSPAALRALGDGTSVIPIGKLVFNHVRRSILDKQRFDLLQLGKYLAASIVDYKAKQEIVPDMLILRKAYHAIQAPSTNNMGNMLSTITNIFGQSEKIMKGDRKNAISQFDSQMERVLQVNFDQDTTKKKFGAFGTKILNTKEKERKQEIEELLDKDLGDSQRKKLEGELEALGSEVNAEDIIQSMLNFQRFISLAYNVGSGVTNAMEGFVSNFIAASKGEYFHPDRLFDAIAITRHAVASRLHNSNTSRKLKTIMDRFALIQDSTNEFQKADYDRSGILRRGLALINPYYVNRSVEYFNQAQLIVAKMLDTPVQGTNGVSNLWEALNDDGQLKPEFRTEANQESWENVRSDEYQLWKSDANAMIESHHGNYDLQRGMQAKDAILGRAVMMFKTFITNQFFIRYGMRQPYVEGSDRSSFKGYYRSLTPTMGAAVGAGIGAITIGGALAPIALAGAGLAVGLRNGIHSDIGVMGELATLLQAYARKAAGIPLNLFTAAAGQGQVFSSDTRETFKSAGFNDYDAQNMSAVVTELAWLMNLVMMYMGAQMFWDDDEDRKSNVYKYSINTLGSYINQITAYTSPTSIHKTATSASFLVLLNNIVKFTDSIGGIISGEDTITTGQYKGQSKFGRSTQKLFIPKVALPTLDTDGVSGFFGSDNSKQVFQHSMIKGIHQKTEKQKKRAKKAQERAK